MIDDVSTKEIAALEARLVELDAEKTAIEEAIDEIRFRGWPRYAVGETVLVPRKIIGKRRTWRARIAAVHFNYMEGRYPEHYEPKAGESWSRQWVSYSVFYEQQGTPDGYARTSEGYRHDDIEPLPEESSAPI